MTYKVGLSFGTRNNTKQMIFHILVGLEGKLVDLVLSISKPASLQGVLVDLHGLPVIFRVYQSACRVYQAVYCSLLSSMSTAKPY